MMLLTYKQWLERDTTFNLIIDAIYQINRGERKTLEMLLKEEYKKYLGELK
jgi:hypothetical protein